MITEKKVNAYVKLVEFAEFYNEWFNDEFTARDLKKYSKLAPCLEFLRDNNLVEISRKEDIEIKRQARGYVDADGNLVDVNALYEKRSKNIRRSEFIALLGSLYDYQLGIFTVKAQRYYYKPNFERIERYIMEHEFEVKKYLSHRMFRIADEQARLDRKRQRTEKMLSVVE